MTNPLNRFVLASNNSGKLWELRESFTEAFQQHNSTIEIIAQAELSVPEWAETGKTFIENALSKARHATEYTGLPALGDDSGLCVEALHGAPGLYSARYAGPKASMQENMQKLLTALKDTATEQRRAYFYCVLVFLRHKDDPMPIIAEGRWAGSILSQAIGEHGFGYDPIFYVPEYQCSAANLKPEIKRAISHRGIALTTMIQALKNMYLSGDTGTSK